MFILREDWAPSEKNRRLIGERVGEILSFSLEYQLYFDGNRNRLAFDLDYAERFFKRGDKVLEIGAFPFFLTLPLITSYDVTTLDKIEDGQFTPNAISPISKYNVGSLDCDLDYDPIPAATDSFDGIIMNEVFEHLRVNLIFTMREVFRVLRPGGILLLSTPNLRSLWGIFNYLFRGYAFACMGGVYENYLALETIGVMGHTREFTSMEVVDFLQKIGFAIEGVIYRGSYSGWSKLPCFGWKRRWGSTIAHQFTRAWPQFRPFFSVVARKPRHAGTKPAPAVRRHRVRCFDGAGGGSWRDGSLPGSSSLRLCA
jgi:SAM-dependent methyltransferase